MSNRWLAPLAVLALSLIGCGNKNNNTQPPGTEPPAMDMPDMAPLPPDLALPSRDPTDHPELPQVDFLGGKTLAAMDAWVVVWKGDDAIGQQTIQFLNWMLQSDYWVSSLSEYGVGKGTTEKLLVLDQDPPANLDDNDAKALTKSLFAGATPQIPAPNANTVVFFVVNPKTHSTLQGSKGCDDNGYGGYHSETQTAQGSGIYVSYAVNLQCAAGTADAFVDLTDTLSHEAAEAATDPHPYTSPGWTNQTNPLGGEVGDLCVGLISKQAANITDADGGVAAGNYYVTRIYSQKAAKAGTSDPCVPAPATHPYFNVGVEPRDIDVKTDKKGNGQVMAKIEPYAFGDVGELKWKIEDPGPGITVDPMVGTNMPGDTIALMVTVTADAQSGTYPLILSTTAKKGGRNLWFSSITVE
jgi:hypothetical protein